MPLTTNPLNTPFQIRTMLDKNPKRGPQFRAKLQSYYMILPLIVSLILKVVPIITISAVLRNSSLIAKHEKFPFLIQVFKTNPIWLKH